MFKKICFLVNYNLYESKRHFTEKLAEALKKRGVQSTIIDVNEGTLTKAEIAAIHAFKPDMTASFNSFLPVSNKRYLWDMLQTPHLSMLLDPAIYSVNLIDSRFSMISCVDKFDCDGLRSQNFNRTFFFPHGIEAEVGEEVKDKKYDVVFLGSCYDYESMRADWQKKLSAPMAKALDDACDIFLSDGKTPLQEALVRAWNQNNLPIQGVDFLSLFYWLDNYTRGYDRVQLIRSIKDAHVHVFGELSCDDESATKGWEHYLSGMSNVTIHPSVSYAESLEILKQSKICLNSSPFFKNGSHERMFAGPACGALVVTNDNLYVREQFKDGENIILYQPKHWDSVNEKIAHFLNDEEARQSAVKSAHAAVEEHHTWDARAELFIKEVSAIKI